jgi:hypothetical protein
VNLELFHTAWLSEKSFRGGEQGGFPGCIRDHEEESGFRFKEISKFFPIVAEEKLALSICRTLSQALSELLLTIKDSHQQTRRRFAIHCHNSAQDYPVTWTNVWMPIRAFYGFAGPKGYLLGSPGHTFQGEHPGMIGRERSQQNSLFLSKRLCLKFPHFCSVLQRDLTLLLCSREERSKRGLHRFGCDAICRHSHLA